MRNLVLLLLAAPLAAQNARPALPPAQNIPAPGPAAAPGTPYAPQPILPGGVVVPLYPPNSPLLKRERIHEAEKYNMSASVPGRIDSIVNIHYPSLEFHPTSRGLNTGTAIIVAAGGGHRTLNVGSEAADVVHFLYQYGINTVILRNRLRSDGYEPRTDAVRDALQAIRIVRAYAKEWNLDPAKIGIMGFSAGAELSAPAAVEYPSTAADPADSFASVSARPDFTVLVYPGPTPFTKNRTAPPIPPDVPPAFLVCPGTGDAVHAVWAMEYYSAMLAAKVPNIEMHLYGNGVHGGALTDRRGIPFGTWQFRFIDWLRDLGFLQPAGTETKAARDVKARP